MLREDSNQPFWKEKFLAGLPTLLGERVRNTIRQSFGTHIIPYDQLTYGELISTTQKEGLKICQDLKLQKHLKWELKKSKKELGSFCKQFDYSYSQSKMCKGDCSKKSSSKKLSKDKFHKKRTSEEPFYKKPHRKTPHSKDRSSKPKRSLKDVTCYKCGKKGHISKYCKVSKKIQELDLEDETMTKLSALLIETSESDNTSSEKGYPQIDEIATTSSTDF